MKSALCCALLAALLVSVFAPPGFSHPKTDVVVLRNGDRITCEIKQLARGKLEVKTDDMGTLQIEWDKIRELKSEYHFQVTGATGDLYFGSLDLSPDTRQLRVAMMDVVAGIAHESVVEITPIEKTFWSRMDGSLSFGFDFTKASNVAQASFDWTTIYRGERNVGDFKASTLLTDKKTEEEVTNRVDVSLGINHLLGRKKWFGKGSIGYQRNDELGLNNRVILTVGAGLNALRSNNNLLRTSVGLAWNAEESTDSSQTQQSLEAVFQLNYQLFSYDSPKTDVVTVLDIFPSLTEEDRYRIEFDARARREVVSDLFLEIRYFTSADTRSPATGSWKSDYGIIASVGWSY